MKRERDAENALSWLLSSLSDSSEGPSHRVTEVVPSGYSAYVRIFHSWFAEYDASVRSTWRRWAELANIRFDGDLASSRIEIALRNFSAGVNWMIDEGEPDQATRSSMVRVLSTMTSPQPVFFSYELPIAARGIDSPVVIRASLHDLDRVRRNMGSSYPDIVGPTHWWPEDRSWVVGSDYDLWSTYVACSADLADALILEPGLESAAVNPNSRVDNQGGN